MENITLPLIVGICSSLIATAAFITLSELSRKVILPWYADKIYRGVRVDGKWMVSKVEEKEINSEKDVFSFELIQKGDRISGIYYHNGDDPGELETYELSGRIRDTFFIATAIPKSNRLIDGASFLLHIDHNCGKLRMTGGVLCKDSPGKVKAISHIQFVWVESS